MTGAKHDKVTCGGGASGDAARARMVWIYSADDEAVSPRRPRSSIPRKGHLVVVVVAPDLAMGEWVCDELERVGYRVVLAESGRRCIHLLQSGEVDVVISDMEQRDLPGLDLLRELQTLTAKAKVILTTSLLSDWRTSRAIGLGASAVLRRPFRIERLLSLLATALESEPSSIDTSAIV